MLAYSQQLQQLISNALQEDVGSGDYSTLSTIAPNARGCAVLRIKEAGVLAGVAVAEAIFRFIEPNCQFKATMADGDAMVPGQEAFTLGASVHTILKGERLALNCMQRMSGIATLTRSYTRLLEGYTTRLLDTRKTTPNFRLLEKEAVRIGGGSNHRFGLYDMIMLKDNHIDYAGGIEAAVEKAWQYVQQHRPGLRIEVETRSLHEVKRVLATGKADVIMLDNFTPEQVAEALVYINKQAQTEASGGITHQNIQAYAATGVDFVSSGAIIHQARSLDLSLKAIPCTVNA